MESIIQLVNESIQLNHSDAESIKEAILKQIRLIEIDEEYLDR